MTAFLNSFMSYLLLFLIMALLAGTGIFAGIVLRKRKSRQAEESAEIKEQEA